MNNQKPSEYLFDFHKKVEGYSSTWYYDTNNIKTQGVGHTSDQTYPITEEPWSDEKIKKVWEHDLKEATDLANKWLNHTIPQPWFDVTVDLIFNCGKPKTYLAMVNEGDYEGARKQIVRWIYDNGKVYLGLVKRRFANYAMTLGHDPEPFINCNATSKNIAPLNELLAQYGYELIPDSKTNWRLLVF